MDTCLSNISYRLHVQDEPPAKMMRPAVDTTAQPDGMLPAHDGCSGRHLAGQQRARHLGQGVPTSAYCGTAARRSTMSFARPRQPAGGIGSVPMHLLADSTAAAGNMQQHAPQMQPRAAPTVALPPVPDDSPPLAGHRDHGGLPASGRQSRQGMNHSARACVTHCNSQVGQQAAPTQRASAAGSGSNASVSDQQRKRKQCSMVLQKLLQKARVWLFEGAMHPDDAGQLRKDAIEEAACALVHVPFPMTGSTAEGVARALAGSLQQLCTDDAAHGAMAAYFAKQLQKFSVAFASSMPAEAI